MTDWPKHLIEMSIYLHQVTHNCAGSTLYGVVSEQDLAVVFNTEGGGEDNRWPEPQKSTHIITTLKDDL